MTRIIIIITLALASPALAFFGSDPGTYDSLPELTDAMAAEMKAALTGRRLYLDRDEIRDEQDGSSSPFAGLLGTELERALSSAGFTFEGQIIDRNRSVEEQRLAAMSADLTDYKVVASYRVTAGKVQVVVKIRDNGKNQAVRSLKGTYGIAMNKLPAELFTDTLDNRLFRLASRFSGGWQRQGQITVFVAPVLEARKRYSSPFAEYVTRKLKAVLAARSDLRIIEENRDLRKQQADRLIKKQQLDVALSDDNAGAEHILEGNYLRSMKQSVNLAVSLKDVNGRVLVRAEDDIPSSLVTYSMDNDSAETLSQITDIEHETSGGAVRIATSKGGDYQVYREGETISFTLGVTKPLYVYVYDINPSGEASLLYPKTGESETPKTPGIVYTIPEKHDTWEIKVEPPFGADAVKVFASDRRLPLPTVSSQVASRSFANGTRSLTRVEKTQSELATMKQINGFDLVDWYKGVAASKGAPLYEATVYVETRGK